MSVSISAELLLHKAGRRHAAQLQQIDRAWAQHGALQRAASGAAVVNVVTASFCLDRLASKQSAWTVWQPTSAGKLKPS